MLVKQFVYKGNQIHTNFFLSYINISKIVENHSVPELQTTLFSRLLLSGRGSYKEV